jgi:hypothetical protein
MSVQKHLLTDCKPITLTQKFSWNIMSSHLWFIPLDHMQLTRDNYFRTVLKSILMFKLLHLSYKIHRQTIISFTNLLRAITLPRQTIMSFTTLLRVIILNTMIEENNWLNMKRKLKQLWPTIPPILTKWTIASHHNSLNTNKGDHNVGNAGPRLGQAENSSNA